MLESIARSLISAYTKNILHSLDQYDKRFVRVR
jgi:hypothetical protein